jgi:hypothetical protein
MKPWIAGGIAGFVLLAGANPALAQMAQDSFHFTLPADITIGRDYGFLAHDQKLTDTIVVVRPPQLSFTNNSQRADFNASYQPEIELFDNNRDLNALNHTGTAGFAFRISERLKFNATDDALVTQDPTRSIAGGLIFLPRRSFKQNMGHAALNYAMTAKNTLIFSFDNVAASAPLNTAAFPGTGNVRSSGTVSLAHAFVRKQTVTATYSLLNGYAQFAGVSYESDFAHDLTVHLSTGLLKDGGENYLMSGQIEKRLGTVWVNAGYHRFLSVFGTSIPGGIPIGNDLVLPAGVSRTNLFQVVSAGISGKLSSRTGVEVEAAVTMNNSGIANRDINNAAGRFKLDYRLTERLKIYTDLQLYRQTFNVFVAAPIDRRRYIAGIQVDISSHPNYVPNIPEQTKPSQR